MSFFSTILILLGVSVAMVLLCRRLHLPPILGYLTVGLLIGPNTFGLIESDQTLRLTAEFGIAFLLFSIGLEFSLSQMLAMKKNVLGMGGLQVAFTSLILLVIFTVSGLAFDTRLVLAFALIMSSTAVVIKQLSELGELHSSHGGVAIGTLLFQDFIAIPILIIVSALSSDPQITDFAWIFMKSLAAITLLMLFGHYVLPRLFKEVASAQSPELFTLATLLVIFSAAMVTHWLNLPLALGSFIAGMMLGESKYRYQIESDIRPFKDIFMGLFFVSVGMLINPKIFFEHWYLIPFLAVILMFLKGGVIFIAAYLLRYPLEIALRSALILAHVGEFGFAIITLAVGLQVLPLETAEMAIAISIVTLFIAPLLVNHNSEILNKLPWYRYKKLTESHQVKVANKSAQNHVILCGFGRVAQVVARLLTAQNIPYLALDMDPKRIEMANQGGEPVYYGNSAEDDVLKAMHLRHAQFAVITYSNELNTLKTIRTIKRLQPDIKILVRGQGRTISQKYLIEGAFDVIQEPLETALIISEHAMRIAGVKERDIKQSLKKTRHERHHQLESYYQGEKSIDADKIIKHTLTISADSTVVWDTLAKIPLSDTEVQVIAVRRNGVLGEEPSPSLIIQPDDVLILQGTSHDIELLQERIQAW